MFPIDQLDPLDIRGVVYLGKPPTGVKFVMKNGDTHLYSGDSLQAALDLARRRRQSELSNAQQEGG